MLIRMLLLLALTAAARAESPPRTIVCLGDSLTAGYGLSVNEAWPALLQSMIAEAGLSADVVNAGVSGDTTAGGLRRMDWVMHTNVAVVILALGANDGLRGLATGELERNLQGIIDRARAANPDVRILIAGMRAPPNMGAEYVEKFDAVFPRVAEKNGAALWPFMLEGVGGVPEMNLEDGIHPNAEGQRRIADMAWKHLRPLLETP